MLLSRQNLDFILVSVENALLATSEVGVYLARKKGILRDVRISRVFV